MTRASPADAAMSTTHAASSAPPCEPQATVAVEEQMEQCMKMLEGKSDEHKFAGLLMITKLSGLDDTRLWDLRRRVVDIVGVSFFLRLLVTRGDSEDVLSSFQVLGLNLIASFCEDPSVAELFAVEKTVRFVLEQLTLLGSPPSASTVDCVSILQGLARSDTGAKLLTQEGIAGRIVNTLKKMLRVASSSLDAESVKPAKGEVTIDQVLSAYWAVVERLSTLPTFWNHLASYDFEFLCSAFSQTRGGGLAIQIVAVFNNFMRHVETDSVPTELLSSRSLSDLRVGLVQFVRSKWTGHERDECLRLVFQLMQHSGIAWMLPGTTLRSQEPQDEVSSGKFVLLVLKLAGVEIKLMLDEVELALIQMEEKTIERVDEETRQAQEVQRAMAVLPICYGIVESVIAGLVSNADDEMLPYDVLLQLKQSFGDTFTVVLEHLTAARDFMKTHRYKDLLAAESPAVYQLDAVVFASVRVISAWLAEDSDTCLDQVIDLLPFLVCYTPLRQVEDSPPVNNQHSVCDLDSDDEELDSDDEVDTVSELLRSTAQIQEDDSPIDQLHFLLPGLLQISATPEGAQVIAEDVDVLRRVLRFCCSLCANFSSEEDQLGGVPTMTLCLGILMNLLLLRSSNVEVTASGRAASPLPNAIEWYRALSFLLPLACASGSHVSTEAALTEEERGEDDRYVMVLHVACVVLLIASNFQDKKSRPATRLSSAVLSLVAPFNLVIEWLLAHPPDASSESATDLLELCRGLAMRSPLTREALQ